MDKTILYSIWGLVPLFFFGSALWSALDRVGSKGKRHEDLGNLLRQGVFVSVCVLVAIVVDQYLLETIVQGIESEWLPHEFFQIILLPVILWVGALMAGPSREIRIEKHGKPGRKR